MTVMGFLLDPSSLAVAVEMGVAGLLTMAVMLVVEEVDVLHTMEGAVEGMEVADRLTNLNLLEVVTVDSLELRNPISEDSLVD